MIKHTQAKHPQPTTVTSSFLEKHSSPQRPAAKASSTDLLGLGSGSQNLGSGLVRVLLEVLVEELAELVDLVGEGGGRSPAVLGVEKLIGNAGAGLGHRQVEDVVGLVLGLGELTRVDGVEDGTSVLERATLAARGGTGTHPAGVQEPSISLVLLDLLSQHGSVAHGVQSQEGLGEAGREGGLRFRHTVLGAGHLGGVAGDEVEHGLLRGELGDGGGGHHGHRR